MEDMSGSRAADVSGRTCVDESPARSDFVSDLAMAKVLLIEDDAETAKEIRAELIERGFEVDWAATIISPNRSRSSSLSPASKRCCAGPRKTRTPS